MHSRRSQLQNETFLLILRLAPSSQNRGMKAQSMEPEEQGGLCLAREPSILAHFSLWSSEKPSTESKTRSVLWRRNHWNSGFVFQKILIVIGNCRDLIYISIFFSLQNVMETDCQPSQLLW